MQAQDLQLLKKASLHENFNVWNQSSPLSSTLEVASKPLTGVGDISRDRRVIIVHVIRRRNMADVESQPLYDLEAGGGKQMVMLSSIDEEIRMSAATDEVVHKRFVYLRNCPFSQQL